MTQRRVAEEDADLNANNDDNIDMESNMENTKEVIKTVFRLPNQSVFDVNVDPQAVVAEMDVDDEDGEEDDEDEED